MKRNVIALLIAFFAAVPGTAVGQEVDEREHIEVVGAAEVKVVPDEFVIRANLTSFEKSLENASSNLDAAVARVFKRVSRFGVPRKYIVTDEIAVTTVTEGYRERQNFRRLGYTVSRNVMIVLHDATQVEPVMKELFAVGVDRLTMSSGHTQIASLLENAQIQAATSARRKGTRLSSALGRQLGEAIAIAEDAPRAPQPRSFVYTVDTPDLGDTISLGKIRVQASVRVKFLLR